METDDCVQSNGIDIPVERSGVKTYSENCSPDAETGFDNSDDKFDNVAAEQTGTFLERHKKRIFFVRNCIFLLLFLAYYSYAMYCNFGDEASIRLTVFTGFGLAYIGWNKSLQFKSFRTTQKTIFSIVSLVYKNDRGRKFIRW